jgi:hypothetical protein
MVDEGYLSVIEFLAVRLSFQGSLFGIELEVAQLLGGVSTFIAINQSMASSTKPNSIVGTPPLLWGH